MTPAKKRLFSILSAITFVPAILTGIDLISLGKEKVGWITAIGGLLGLAATWAAVFFSKRKEN
jgi:nicotinamide riboside transporter PnuC